MCHIWFEKCVISQKRRLLFFSVGCLLLFVTVKRLRKMPLWALIWGLSRRSASWSPGRVLWHFLRGWRLFQINQIRQFHPSGVLLVQLQFLFVALQGRFGAIIAQVEVNLLHWYEIVRNQLVRVRIHRIRSWILILLCPLGSVSHWIHPGNCMLNLQWLWAQISQELFVEDADSWNHFICSI